MTREEIFLFEKVSVQLQSFHDETAVLVKKDPKAEFNKFKLNLINKVLTKANEILKDMKPFEDFNVFDADSLPNNGDVMMILGQYINCLEKIRIGNIHIDFGTWYWNIDGINNNVNKEIRTYIPQKYKK